MTLYHLINLAMASIEQFVQALLKLGYANFQIIKAALDMGDRRKAKSIWGKLAITIFGKNKACKREYLYLKWRLNRGNFQQLVKDMTKGNIRKSVDYSDITMLAVS